MGNELLANGENMNWNSDTHQWSDVVRPGTKAKAAHARAMRRAGKSVATIAVTLDLSKSRIYELLRT